MVREFSLCLLIISGRKLHVQWCLPASAIKRTAKPAGTTSVAPQPTAQPISSHNLAQQPLLHIDPGFIQYYPGSPPLEESSVESSQSYSYYPIQGSLPASIPVPAVPGSRSQRTTPSRTPNTVRAAVAPYPPPGTRHAMPVTMPIQLPVPRYYSSVIPVPVPTTNPASPSSESANVDHVAHTDNTNQGSPPETYVHPVQSMVGLDPGLVMHYPMYFYCCNCPR